MPNMRAVQVSRAGGPLELVERPIPEPGPGTVRIKVEACGICHSDALTKDGVWPGIQFPRVPGHEVIGTIAALGAVVPPRWQVGQRVGVGWHAWHCGYCDTCRRGDYYACQTGIQVTGISFDGGYAEYMIAPATALALVPSELRAADAAPLMCAGLTTFNALRHSGAQARRPGRHSGHRRARAPGRSIRGQDGLSHGGHRPRTGQAAARPAAGRIALHRQRVDRPGRRAHEARWCESRAGHRHARPSDERHTRRPGPARSAVGPRRGGQRDRSLAARPHHGPPCRRGLVFRHIDRRPGNAHISARSRACSR